MPFNVQQYVNDEALGRFNLDGSTFDGKSIGSFLNVKTVSAIIGGVLGIGVGGWLGTLIGGWLGGWLSGLFNQQYSDEEIRQKIAEVNPPSWCDDLITFDNIRAAEKENRDGGNILGTFKWRIIAFNVSFGSTTTEAVLQKGDPGELDKCLQYFIKWAEDCENNDFEIVGGKRISGDNHRVMAQIIKAGCLRVANMFGSRYEEVTGEPWGGAPIPAPGGGYQPPEGQAPPTPPAAPGEKKTINIGGVELEQKTALMLAAGLFFALK